MSPTAPALDIGLPVIPWHGGPDYFKQFPAALAWADPKFFPIGAFWRKVNSQADIDADKAAGLNGYFCTSDDAPLQLIKRNGMFVTNPVRGFGSHVFTNEGAETIARFLGDEPDWKLGPGSDGWSVGRVLDPKMGFCVAPFADPRHPQCGYTALSAYKAKVEPAMFAHWNGTRHMIALHGKDSAAAWIKGKWADWITADCEFYCDPTLRRPQTGGRLILGQHWNDNNFDPNTYTVSEEQARRASNYGRVVERLHYLCEVAGVRIPVGGYVEVVRNWQDNTEYPVEITGPQFQGAIWSCIINGAYGLIIQDSLWLQHPGGKWGQAHRQLRSNAAIAGALKQIATKINALALVINSPRYAWDFSEPMLDTRLSLDGEGRGYIWAQQNHLTNSLGGGTYQMTLPDYFKGATEVEALDDNRAIPVSRGKFADSFAAEHSTNIYRVVRA